MTNQQFNDILVTQLGETLNSKGAILVDVLRSIAEGEQAPYKVYTALLTQSSTDAPTANVLQNTTNATITYSYDSVGNFLMTFNGITLEENKLFYLKNTKTGEEDEQKWLHISFVDSETLALNTSDGTGSNSNDFLLNTSIEIRVYN